MVASPPTAADAVTVFGAGAIGCYLGAALAEAGAAVTLVARPRVIAEIREHGVTLTDLDGRHSEIAADALTLVTEVAEAPPASLVLVTVKSRDTAAAAAALAPALTPGAAVVSFQNGVANASILAEKLGAERVIAGMVPFNVVQEGPGRLHRGTEGALAIADRPALAPRWRERFERAGLALAVHAGFERVQWAKLLLNLNNPINALAGVPLVEELRDRDHRRVLAAVMGEALEILAEAGIRPARLTPVPPALVPWILRLPTWLFERIARSMLAMDPHARSSMWDDLTRGRPTEIDAINGAVTRLAARIGRDAPRNKRIAALIRAAEREGRGSPGMSGEALWRQLQSADAGGRDVGRGE